MALFFTVVAGGFAVWTAYLNSQAAELSRRAAAIALEKENAALQKYEKIADSLNHDIRAILDTSEAVLRDSAFKEVQVALRANGLDIVVTATYEYKLLDTANFSYASGRYALAESPAALSATRYLRDVAIPLVRRKLGSSPALVDIEGTSDGRPVSERAIYSGDLRVIRDFPYMDVNAGQLRSITIGPGNRLTNASIAFCAALPCETA